MFRLPVCPHCGTVYRYQDVKKALKKKENTCYHCKKPFRVHLLPYVPIWAAVFAALCVGINILILTRIRELSLIPLFAVTVGFLLLFWILLPFFLSFRKTEAAQNHTTKKTNKSQQIKTKNQTKKTKK